MIGGFWIVSLAEMLNFIVKPNMSHLFKKKNLYFET